MVKRIKSMREITGVAKSEYELYEALKTSKNVGKVTQLRPVNLTRLASFPAGATSVVNFLNLPPNKQATILRDALLSQFGSRAKSLAQKIAEVPREEFVPAHSRKLAYVNGIIVVSGTNALTPPGIAFMSAERLKLTSGSRVGVLGFGNGYLTAVYANIVGKSGQVVAWEIDSRLVERGRHLLRSLGIQNVLLHEADATKELPDSNLLNAFWATVSVEKPPVLWRESVPEGCRMGIFRSWTAAELRQREGHQARLQDYLRGKWWENSALSFCRKVGVGLHEDELIGDVFNVPIETGDTESPIHDPYSRFVFYEDRLRDLVDHK